MGDESLLRHLPIPALLQELAENDLHQFRMCVQARIGYLASQRIKLGHAFWRVKQPFQIAAILTSTASEDYSSLIV